MKSAGWIAASITVPVIVMSVELFIGHHFLQASADWDYASIGLALLGGIFCLWRLPVSIAKRVWMTVAYIPVGVVALMFYSLLFVCFVFGDCL